MEYFTDAQQFGGMVALMSFALIGFGVFWSAGK